MTSIGQWLVPRSSCRESPPQSPSRQCSFCLVENWPSPCSARHTRTSHPRCVTASASQESSGGVPPQRTETTNSTCLGLSCHSDAPQHYSATAWLRASASSLNVLEPFLFRALRHETGADLHRSSRNGYSVHPACRSSVVDAIGPRWTSMQTSLTGGPSARQTRHWPC